MRIIDICPGSISARAQATILYNGLENYIFESYCHIPGANELNNDCWRQLGKQN